MFMTYEVIIVISSYNCISHMTHRPMSNEMITVVIMIMFSIASVILTKFRSRP